MNDKTKIINAKWLIKDNMFVDDSENVEEFVEHIDNDLENIRSIFLGRKEKIDVYLMTDIEQKLTLLQSLIKIIMEEIK